MRKLFTLFALFTVLVAGAITMATRALESENSFSATVKQYSAEENRILVSTEQITMKIVPSPDTYMYDDKYYFNPDYIKEKIGTLDFGVWTDKWDPELGKLVWDNTPTCYDGDEKGTGFWFGDTTYENEEEQVVVDNAGWGKNSFAFMVNSKGEFTWFQFPGQRSVGDEYTANVYLINYDNGKYIKFIINVIYVDAVSEVELAEGEDCSDLFTNIKFTDPMGEGWVEAFPHTALNYYLYGGIWPGFPCAEAFHGQFDIYQEVNVPNGVYSVTFNGFDRIDDSETEVDAEIYINDNATKFMNVIEDQIPYEEAVDGFNCYISNGDSCEAIMSNPIFEGNDHSSPADNQDSEGEIGYYPNGMEGASVAFSVGRYVNKAYGIVTNGKMRLGIRNTKSVNQWACWSNLSVTYLGNSADAVKVLLDQHIANAEAYLAAREGIISKPAYNDLVKAIGNARTATDAESADAVIKALNAEIDNASENIKAIQAFVPAQDRMKEVYAEIGEGADANVKAQYNALAGLDWTEMTTSNIVEFTLQIKKCTSMLSIPEHSSASLETPVDFTSLIINPSFDTIGDFTGWDANGSNSWNIGGTFAPCAEQFENNFNTFQDIESLPEGLYALSVQGFYRKGFSSDDFYYYKTEFTSDDQLDEYEAYLYAETSGGMKEAKLPHLSDGIVEEENAPEGYYVNVEGNLVVPNTMEAGDYWMQAGYYKMNAPVYIYVPADGQLRIGVHKENTLGGDWVLVDNFHLEYLGKTTEEPKVKELVRGDLNYDGTVNVGDYTLAVDYTLERQYPEPQNRKQADPNRDGHINIGDVTTIVNIILGKTTNNSTRALVAKNADIEIAVECLGTVGNAERYAIALNGTMSVAGFQMDIKGANIIGKSLTERANGHNIYAHGNRILATGIEANAFKGTDGAVMLIDIENGKNATIENIVVSDANGYSYTLDGINLGEATAIANVKTDTASDAFSVSGVKTSGLQRGINIIRKADGSVTKVIK